MIIAAEPDEAAAEKAAVEVARGFDGGSEGQLFAGMFVAHAEGRLWIAISTITLAEILAGPFRKGADALESATRWPCRPSASEVPSELQVPNQAHDRKRLSTFARSCRYWVTSYWFATPSRSI